MKRKKLERRMRGIALDMLSLAAKGGADHIDIFVDLKEGQAFYWLSAFKDDEALDGFPVSEFPEVDYDTD